MLTAKLVSGGNKMKESMTTKERWIAALKNEPLDRLPFWPKLNASYVPYQTGHFSEMNLNDLHEWIGSDKHLGVPSCVKTVRKNTSTKSVQKNGTRTIKYITPLGTLTTTNKYDEGSRSWHPVEFPIKRRQDLQIMSLFYSDAVCEFDKEQYENACERIESIGEDAIVTSGLGVSPLMDFLQHFAGVKNAHLMLYDYREEVESLFQEMHTFLCRRAEIIAEKCPASVIYSVENTSTTLISPTLFSQYCYKHLMDYGDIISSAEKMHLLHMCGYLKDVLPYIAKLPAVGIEAFTSPPVGNTTLKDGRTNCPDKCLIGGTNATLWTKSAEEIIDEVKNHLDELPHHRGVVVTSAGVMPPLCKPETIKRVADFVKNYPLSN